MARYALVIGIANYINFTNLPKAVNDAQAIAKVLRDSGRFDVQPLPGKLIESENRWQVAPEKKLTGKELGQTLRTFLLEKAKGQEALIYFAGHGFEAVSLTGEPKGYLATSDCNKDGQNAILFDDFNALIGKSDLASLVVLLDCCYAGSLLERSFIRTNFSVFNSRLNYCLITASRASERAREDAEGGIFTKAVLQELSQDRADEVTGEVSISRLFDGVSRELKGSGQEPIYIGGGSAITLVWYPPKNPVVTAVVSEECPYQGLKAFDKEQARFFFGREKVIQLLVEKLRQANFVPIIGASGSGKSSVVRAGLIPQLEKNSWRILEPILPGDEPLAELKTLLIDLFGRTEGREVYSLIKTEGLRPVIERLSGCERLLLVVDQFEEVFTLCPKEEERRQFIELLTQVSEVPDSRLAIVTTMRADFLEPCLSYESLTRLIQNEAVYMPPLLGAELEEAIEEPTKLQGYNFEKGLLGEILQDMGQEKECLPLLQFALTELWEKRDREKHLLTVEQYRAMGGVTGTLNRHAERIYTYQDFLKESPQQERSPQEQEWINRIFLKLVRTGEGIKDTRQRQPKAKLLVMGSDSVGATHTLPLLDELIQARLLLTGQENHQEEAWVDLAHEALMEGWLRFAQWRQENRELRRLIDRIEDALREWQKEPKDGNLMMGGLLAKVRDKWSELELYLDTSAQDFYHRSEVYKQEQIKTHSGWQIRATKEKLKSQASELKQVLHELKSAQILLIQSEKMSNLRQLVAGVVHEINNPVSFIYNNLIHSREYFQNLINLVKLYQNAYPNPPQLIREHIDAIDFNFMMTDLNQLQESIKLATEHIREIVFALRTFSGVDEVESEAVNIHSGIDSSLMILQNRLNAKPGYSGILVIKEYGNLPLVECYPGHLNQVFFNILANSIDALEEIESHIQEDSKSSFKASIWIRTEISSSNHISVRIADNGLGIQENIKNQIFDPFFTTKLVGKGSGLGLSVSYQIVVEQHGGTIKVRSEPKQGTEIVITLPIRQLSDTAIRAR